MAFKNWIETMMEEKDIDMEENFEFEADGVAHIMPYGAVIEGAIATSPRQQAQIKTQLVRIDFNNGDTKHFLRYLGTLMVKARVAA